MLPRFDLDAAYEKVKQRGSIPEGRIFKPYFMAAVHSRLLPQRYTKESEQRMEDKQGVWWRLEINWSLDSIDLAGLSSCAAECRLMRRLNWYIKLQGRPEYMGFWKLSDHGWKSADSLSYTLVGELWGRKLSKHLFDRLGDKVPP